MIYFDTLGVPDMQFRNQSVLAIWMWVTMKSFQITFWGSLVLLKLIPYFCVTIKPTIFAIYFDTLGVPDMQFRNQSVLAIWMWVTMKSFQITFWGSLVLLKLIPYFCGTIKPTIFVIYFDTLVVWDMTNLLFFFLAELFRGILFKWKGENKKSHQKWDLIVNLRPWLAE